MSKPNYCWSDNDPRLRHRAWLENQESQYPLDRLEPDAIALMVSPKMAKETGRLLTKYRDELENAPPVKLKERTPTAQSPRVLNKKAPAGALFDSIQARRTGRSIRAWQGEGPKRKFSK